MVKKIVLALYKYCMSGKKNIGRQLVNRFGPPIRFKNSENKKINSDEGESNEDKKDKEIKENDFMNNHYPLHSEYENDESKYSTEVGFLIVATGKYDVFVETLIESIEKFVLPKNKKYYNIFTDKDIKIKGVNYQILPIEHRPFPYPTLKRFHFFNTYSDKIIGEQLIYIDADTLIKENIGTEILYPITVTQHCGFVNKLGSFEKRQLSKCYVPVREAKNYYGGGFYSFNRDEFFKMSSFCMTIINLDESMGIIPIWHDESAINKYLTTLVPTKVLSPSYHYPENNHKIYESWGGREKFICKILLLDKDHKEIRS